MSRKLNKKVSIGILAVAVIVEIALLVKGITTHSIGSVSGSLLLLFINCMTLTYDVFSKKTEEEISAS